MAKAYLECVKCHSSGQAPDGRRCPECNGQGRWEILDGDGSDRVNLPTEYFHDLAVVTYMDSLSND